MRKHKHALYAAVVLAIGLGSASTWALDVKAGLWQISIEGMPEVQKACFTRELLDADLSDLSALKMPEGVQCKNEIREQNPRFTVTHTACSGPFGIEGDSRIDVQSPESMLLTSTSVMTIAGQQQTVRSNAQYKWLSSDCGEVKPIDLGNMLD
jgi:hypothetical protein